MAHPAVQSVPSAKAPAVLESFWLAWMMLCIPLQVIAVQLRKLLLLAASVKNELENDGLEASVVFIDLVEVRACDSHAGEDVVL